MRIAGPLASGLGHAGLVGLALVGPPFLWAPPDRPVPAVMVSLLSAADLSRLALAAPPAAGPAAQPDPTPPPPMPPPLLPPPSAMPAVEAAPPAPGTLAPGPETAAPLAGIGALGDGFGNPLGGTVIEAPQVEAPAEVDPEAERAIWVAKVQRAVALARIYPEIARARGLEGRVALQVVLTPDGELVSAQLLRSSGAMTLDRAALDTVRRAKYPAAPVALEDPRLVVAVEVVFAERGR